MSYYKGIKDRIRKNKIPNIREKFHKMSDDEIIYHLLKKDDYWRKYPLTHTATNDKFWFCSEK